MRAWVAGVLLAVSGCSFVVVDRPPAVIPPHGRISCDSSAVTPNVVDLTVGTVAGLIVGGFFWAMSIDESRPQSERPATETIVAPALFGMLAAAPWYASAYIGHGRARECRDLKRRNGTL